MNVIALDLATHCGVAHVKPGWCLSDVWDFTPKRRGEPYGGRFQRFETMLEFYFLIHGPMDLVAYEKPRRHKGAAAAHVFGGLEAVLAKVCCQQGIRCEGVTPEEIKQWATGNRRAPKERMVAAAAEFGWKQRVYKRAGGVLAPSDDEADAICLLEYALTNLCSPTGGSCAES